MYKLKIISGGQTGVDKSALDFALDNNIECGGFCTRGRKCESGIIPTRFPLIEIESDKYIDRTRKNIIESDATLIIRDTIELFNGTLNTIELCDKLLKTLLIVNTDNIDIKKLNFYNWLDENNIKVLNIAGNRESENPGICTKTYLFLNKLFNQ